MPSEPDSASHFSRAVLESPGDQSLSITIEKMGFKDATLFIDPFFTVSLTGERVKGVNGLTPISFRRRTLSIGTSSYEENAGCCPVGLKNVPRRS